MDSRCEPYQHRTDEGSVTGCMRRIATAIRHADVSTLEPRNTCRRAATTRVLERTVGRGSDLTRDEAIAVVTMITNSWPKPDWTAAQTETYVNSLVPYDADLAVQAVALAHKELSFRPPFADLLGFYKRAGPTRGPPVQTSHRC